MNKLFCKINHMSSPSKLFSCVDSAAILKSPINDSTAKSHWSFSKDSRFKASKVYCDSFYNIPDNKNSRNTSFGFGKKTDLDFDKNSLQVVPPSNTYNIQSFVETNKKKNKGFTPRFSRQEIAPMSYINLESQKVPGPGRYEEFFIKDTPYWSFRPRVNSQLFPQTSQKIVPGPGAHQNTQVINKKGRYSLSKNRSSKCKTFNPPNSKRFNKSSTDIPGSGTYNPKNDLPEDGNYILSKNKSARNRAFLMGKRQSFVEDMPKRVQTPGPGTYRLPSDFGHYDQQKQFARTSFTSEGKRSMANKK